MRLTKDSICKDCIWRKYVLYEEKGVQREEASCLKVVAGEMAGDVKVLECSEFERVQKGGKIRPVPRPPNWERCRDWVEYLRPRT